MLLAHGEKSHSRDSQDRGRIRKGIAFRLLQSNRKLNIPKRNISRNSVSVSVPAGTALRFLVVRSPLIWGSDLGETWWQTTGLLSKARCLAASLAGSLDRWISGSLPRSLPRSLGRYKPRMPAGSLAASPPRSLDRRLARWIAVNLAGSQARSLHRSPQKFLAI